MEPWPPVTILLVTYDRPAEIRKTIQALDARLQYKGPLLWHLADDGSPPGYVEAIVAEFPGLNFSHSITGRKGWGANVNTALRACQTDYVFLCEDDYVALKDLDLTPAVALLEAADCIGVVRFDRQVGYSQSETSPRVIAMEKPTGPLHPELRLQAVPTRIGPVQFLTGLRQRRSVLIYSHRPHLKHRRFHEHYGYYAEGLALKMTERDFENRYIASKGPQVVCLPSGPPKPFAHIGTSRQNTKEDLETVVEIKKTREVKRAPPQTKRAPPSLKTKEAPPPRRLPKKK